MQQFVWHTAYGDIAYWQNQPEGARETVVLLHGAAMNHAMFALQYQAWASRYRVLVWDMPMHGASRPFMPVSMLQMARFLEDMAAHEGFFGREMCARIAEKLCEDVMKCLAVRCVIELATVHQLVSNVDQFLMVTINFFNADSERIAPAQLVHAFPVVVIDSVPWRLIGHALWRVISLCWLRGRADLSCYKFLQSIAPTTSVIQLPTR